MVVVGWLGQKAHSLSLSLSLSHYLSEDYLHGAVSKMMEESPAVVHAELKQ